MIVHGPYTLSSTCDDGHDRITTVQVARTWDDDRGATSDEHDESNVAETVNLGQLPI